MRILIKLQDEKEQEISNDYHKLQGFVYNLLRNDHAILHSKRGYKFFCFSNIFPYEGKGLRNFIISSPSKDVIDSIEKNIEIGDLVNLGEMQFRIKEYSVFDVKIPITSICIRSSTPIIIRIPESRYEQYNIPVEERKARYVYWRPTYRFEAFVKQLTENLIKKFNDFYQTEIVSYDLFEGFVFKKVVVNNLIIDGRTYPVVGSIWEFAWHQMDPVQRKIIEFGLDAGFGERNSYGFGFVNVV